MCTHSPLSTGGDEIFKMLGGGGAGGKKEGGVFEKGGLIPQCTLWYLSIIEHYALKVNLRF